VFGIRIQEVDAVAETAAKDRTTFPATRGLPATGGSGTVKTATRPGEDPMTSDDELAHALRADLDRGGPSSMSAV
jgi:hypothetical protein